MAARRMPTVALLAAATALAAVLRLALLDSRSLWFDETYTATVVAAGGPGELWDRVGTTESTPPLFYALTWAWTAVAGDGEAALRTVSAVALIAAVPVAYPTLRRFVGERAALATAAILAVSPLLVHYALDARAYGLLVLCGLLSVWACGAVLERPGRRRWIAWVAAAAATIWTHWFGGFLVLGEAVALAWLLAGRRRELALACAAVAATLLPGAWLLAEQAGDGRAAFIEGIPLADRVEQLVRQFALGPNVPRGWLEAAGLALALAGLAAGTLRAIEWSLLPARASRGDQPIEGGARALLAIVAVALVAPLALAALGVYDRFNPRNSIAVVPLLAALAAVGLLRLRAVPLALYLAVAATASVWTAADWRYQTPDWRAAIDAARATDPDAIVAATPLGGPTATHYLGRPPAAGPLTARRITIVVEPERAPGRRELAPTTHPALDTLATAFPDRSERVELGFRIVTLTAPDPVPLDPATLSGALAYPAGRASREPL